MKLFSKPLFTVLLAVGLVIFFNCHRAHADAVRGPVRSGSFYPADASELTRMIDGLTQKAQKTRVRIPAGKVDRKSVV